MPDKNALRLLLFAGMQITLAATVRSASVRYKDATFDSVSVTSNIHYGSNTSATGATENLLLDIYQPFGDTAKTRPLLIFVHGGGFSGGTKSDGDIVLLCRTFAKKGYVTSSIGYRLDPAPTTKTTMGKAVIRAVQDGKAAVRFLRANRADYRIDDTKIMMGGTSAGGVLSLDYAYLDAHELPAFIDTNAMGSMEGKSGTPGVSSAINGIINCWGGVSDSAILLDGKLPVLSFHGTADNTVPYDIGIALNNPDLVTFGSACVHRVLTRMGVKSQLKPFVGMGHGWPSDARADTIITLSTQFIYDVLFDKGSTGILPAGGGAKANRNAGRRSPGPGRTWLVNGKSRKPAYGGHATYRLTAPALRL